VRRLMAKEEREKMSYIEKEGERERQIFIFSRRGGLES